MSSPEELVSIKSDYNDVDFEAWLANDKGQIRKVN